MSLRCHLGVWRIPTSRFPDFSNYRREVTLDTQKAARDTEDQRRSLAHAVYYGGTLSFSSF
ncbi:Ubiquinol cytochrome reductase transmembrane region [Cooperia oncophora]